MNSFANSKKIKPRRFSESLKNPHREMNIYFQIDIAKPYRQKSSILPSFSRNSYKVKDLVRFLNCEIKIFLIYCYLLVLWGE